MSGSFVSLGRVLAASLAALALVTILPSVANAAGDCPEQPSNQVFAPWGDPAHYVLAPDGGFEAGAAGWRLSGGAAVQDGNESYDVAGAGDAHSLALPAGSSATSPPVCISVAHPTIRLFVRNTGSRLSTLRVSVVYRGLLGLPLELRIGTVSGDEAWSPSAPVPILVNLLSLLGDQDVTFRFATAGGEWSIDDVHIDPYSKG
jgi:hypothetical protein